MKFSVQLFRAYFIFDAPATVLTTEAKFGFFPGNISILGTSVAKFKINFPGKVPWERRVLFILVHTVK